MKNYNHYDLNPPNTIAVDDSETDYEAEALNDAIEAHLYEQRYDEYKNQEFLYVENAIKELINNESDQTV